MDLDDIKNILVIGYTAWKWFTEYNEDKKKRSKTKPVKQKSKKRKR